MADIQQFFTVWVVSLADVIPLGYAFGAGMVSAVNPCGFAMLPAYLGLFLGTQVSSVAAGGDTAFAERNTVAIAVPSHLARAILVAAIVTGGFVLLFGGVGLIVSAGGRLIISLIPWIALGIGALLVVLGVAMLKGFHLSASFADRLSQRMGDPRTIGIKGFFVFGIAYATASLSCTLPIFLTVVGGSLTGNSFANSLLQFINYALGMGLIVLAITISMAIFKGAMVGNLQRVVPYVERASAFLLIIAGSYIVYYWLTKGDLV